MKVLVLGAGGIIGQYMRLCVPPNVDATFCRRHASPGYMAFDAANQAGVRRIIQVEPRVVVNLAGESNTDLVERDPRIHRPINVGLPEALAQMPEHIRLIQISSQAVFNGMNPPYRANSMTNAINAYGRQKAEAERAVLRRENTVVIRPTFVLGVRPDPSIGRANPVEQMLAGQLKQVNDRFFSVSFAPEVAAVIWSVAIGNYSESRRIIHAGVPWKTSRYQIARDLGMIAEPVSHASFTGLAPRPKDTTYSDGEHVITYQEGLRNCVARWEAREAVVA